MAEGAAIIGRSMLSRGEGVPPSIGERAWCSNAPAPFRTFGVIPWDRRPRRALCKPNAAEHQCQGQAVMEVEILA